MLVRTRCARFLCQLVLPSARLRSVVRRAHIAIAGGAARTRGTRTAAGMFAGDRCDRRRVESCSRRLALDSTSTSTLGSASYGDDRDPRRLRPTIDARSSRGDSGPRQVAGSRRTRSAFARTASSRRSTVGRRTSRRAAQRAIWRDRARARHCDFHARGSTPSIAGATARRDADGASRSTCPHDLRTYGGTFDRWLLAVEAAVRYVWYPHVGAAGVRTTRLLGAGAVRTAGHGSASTRGHGRRITTAAGATRAAAWFWIPGPRLGAGMGLVGAARRIMSAGARSASTTGRCSRSRFGIPPTGGIGWTVPRGTSSVRRLPVNRRSRAPSAAIAIPRSRRRSPRIAPGIGRLASRRGYRPAHPARPRSSQPASASTRRAAAPRAGPDRRSRIAAGVRPIAPSTPTTGSTDDRHVPPSATAPRAESPRAARTPPARRATLRRRTRRDGPSAPAPLGERDRDRGGRLAARRRDRRLLRPPLTRTTDRLRRRATPDRPATEAPTRAVRTRRAIARRERTRRRSAPGSVAARAGVTRRGDRTAPAHGRGRASRLTASVRRGGRRAQGAGSNGRTLEAASAP